MSWVDAAVLEEFCRYGNSAWQGAQLQDVWTDGKTLVLELRLIGHSGWLCIDLSSACAEIIWSLVAPPLARHPKPVVQFLASHARNKRIAQVAADLDVTTGPACTLVFGQATDACLLRIPVHPRVANLSVEISVAVDKRGTKWQKKILHWQKPEAHKEPLSGQPELPGGAMDLDWAERAEQARLSWWERQGWNENPNRPAAASKGESVQQLGEILRRKRRALEAIQKSLDPGPLLRWRQFGEALKMGPPLDSVWQDLFDSRLSWQDNRERAFRKAKDGERKMTGTRKREREVLAEIAALEAGVVPRSPGVTRGTQMLQKSKSTGRKLQVGEGLEVVIGKSARDNLQILRQARAWDLWLHLRDYPSAHAILFREKGRAVTDAELGQVGRWILRQTPSAGGQGALRSGGEYALLVAECRYVRPVKGALGSVTHQNSRTLFFAAQASE